SSIVERKTNSQCEQTRQKENPFHPCPWVQLALGTNIKNRHRSRCCEKDRNINEQRTQPPALWASGRRVQKHTQTSKQQVGKVRQQIRSGFELDRGRKAAAPNGGQYLLTGLNGAFRPAMLLLLQAVHVHWELCVSPNVRQI